MTPDITILFSLIVTAIVGWGCILLYRFSRRAKKGFEVDLSDFQFFSKTGVVDLTDKNVVLDPVPWGKQRIDVIYVKAPEFSAPEIHVLVGVPAPKPFKPTLNISGAVELGEVRVRSENTDLDEKEKQ